MEATARFKPFHAVLIVLMLALTAALYIYKDKILPDVNAPYREQLGTYIETRAVVISKEAETGRRGSNIVTTVQFRDSGNILHTARITDNALQSVSRGDTITVYRDPENPARVSSERSYKEIMRIN